MSCVELNSILHEFMINTQLICKYNILEEVIEYANDYFYSLFGQVTFISDIIHPCDIEIFRGMNLDKECLSLSLRMLSKVSNYTIQWNFKRQDEHKIIGLGCVIEATSKTKILKLLDNLEIPTIVLDYDGMILDENEQAQKLLQVDILPSATIFNLLKNPIEFRYSFETFLRNKRNFTIESEFLDGRKVSILTSENNGSVLCKLNAVKEKKSNQVLETDLQIKNDIINDKIKQLELQIEEAYTQKSLFLANMSHEIRTPLNGIIGMLTLLEDTKITSDQQDFIEMIKECSFNLMSIINDILDYSKLDAGKIKLDNKCMDIISCIESTNDIILSKIYEKKLEYHYTIDPLVPPVILADHTRIKQVLLNLLSNAIKFTDKGSVQLNVESISSQEYYKINTSDRINDIEHSSQFESDNDIVYLKFSVIDSGCGIEKSDYNKLFKSFSQLTSQITTKVHEGTGLGLAICKKLVNLMKGHVWLETSELNHGSTFSFVMKTMICDSPADNLSDNTFDETQLAFLKGKSVLIVDDNKMNRMSMCSTITKWGMKAFPFSSSEEALFFIKVVPFDIGLIDICIPKIDGFTLASKIRQEPEFNNKLMPLIALSSLGDKVQDLDKYFQEHIVKPVKESKLRKACISLLNAHKTNSNKKELLLQETKQQVTKQRLKHSDTTILLAEDVYINQKVILGFLNKLGYTNVSVAENGKQVLDIMKTKTFDIILLDIKMPILDGVGVLKTLRQHYYYSNHSPINKKQNFMNKTIPYIIAITAYCLKEDKEKYINMGFDDYLPKPIQMHELENCLNSYEKTKILEI